MKIKFWLSLILFWLVLASPAFADKIGFYFGTFDPPHRGHLAVVEAAKKELNLDRVYILPNYDPTNKPGASNFEHRYQMVQLIALRQPEIRILPPEDFKQAYAENAADYIGVLIQKLRQREGSGHQYFHLTGVDSFNKMVAYDKLPLPQENRIVAVLPRVGYQVEMSAAVAEAMERGQVKLLSAQIEGLSSSFIRKAIQAGKSSAVEDKLPEYILAYILREGLFGQMPQYMDLRTLPNIKDHLVERLPTQSSITETGLLHSFTDFELSDFMNLKSLSEPLSLDQDAYLHSKIPEPIFELLAGTQTRIKVVGGTTETPEARTELLHWLATSHHFEPVAYWRPERERIGLHYILGYEHVDGQEPVPYLVVTNIFGEDRLYHVLMQYGRLLQGAGRSLEHLELSLPDNYLKLEAGLCQGALADLEAQKQSTVFIGYHGALNYLLSDLQQYQESLGQSRLENIDLKTLDAFMASEERVLKHPEASGGPYFPYWTYTLNTNLGPHQIISFRNTYGMATTTLLNTLIHKGFHSFVLFGNGGALSERVSLNQIYAPNLFSFERETYLLDNQAVLSYPEVSVLKVRSILDETWPWVSKHQTTDLVDVENFDAARILHAGKQNRFYSGVLVSDRPGLRDITHKDEDSMDLIRLKRDFFFQVLKSLIDQRVRVLVFPKANPKHQLMAG